MVFSPRYLMPIIAGLVIVVSGLSLISSNRPSLVKYIPSTSSTLSLAPTSSVVAVTTTAKLPAVFHLPIDRAFERVTKKPFGLQVSPTNSPVQPERFRGFHTGVDFETFTDEADKDITISAICSGKILFKQWVNGYGGVLVHACEREGEKITVLYGHIRLPSIHQRVGDELRVGQAFAVLGKGFSQETDGERKHLHLGIHKGSSLEIKGYTSTRKGLEAWKDFMEIAQP